MIYGIENGRFRLCVRETGAELCSFCQLEKGEAYEYLWQGGEIWQGQSPLLFPIVGRLREDTYALSGKTYRLEKHGFARKLPFFPEKMGREEMTLILRDNALTREKYPFPFELRAHYALREDGLLMEFRVKNTGGTRMYFSIGAHPAFRCQMGDWVVMDQPENADAVRLDKDALRGQETEAVFRDSREIEITEEIFEKDALIFDGIASGGATLMRRNGRHVHVDFGKAPCLGLWAKPGAAYVCIEPWYGIDDRWNAGKDFTKKERILSLEPGEEFRFPVTVRV